MNPKTDRQNSFLDPETLHSVFIAHNDPAHKKAWNFKMMDERAPLIPSHAVRNFTLKPEEDSPELYFAT